MKSDSKPEASRRGRPPVGEQAMTPAERQRAYRQRQQRRAQVESIGAEAQASRVTLLDSLAYALAQLDTDMPAKQQKATRLTVGRIVQEIITRYVIELPVKPGKG